MVGHVAAAIVKGPRREVAVIAREALLDGAAENGQIMRRGDLLVIRQARRICIVRPGHAEGMGFAGHHLGECVFVAADLLGDGAGDVVRRFGDNRLDRVLDLDG